MIKRISIYKNKLITKFLILYIVVIAIPIISLTSYSFNQLKKANEEQLVQTLENYINSNVKDINGKIYTMIELTELSISKRELIEYFINGSELKVEELMFFKKYYVSDMERLKNVNANIYQMRFYVDNDYFLEMWPIVYSKKRLHNQNWVNEIEETEKQSLWRSFTNELLISNSNDNNSTPKSLISFYREIKYGYMHIGFLEVNMESRNFFSSMYSNDELNGDGFTIVKQGDNSLHFNENNQFIKNNYININNLKREIVENTISDKGYFDIEIEGNRLLVAYEYINLLDIYLYNAVSTGVYDYKYNEQRNIIIIIGFSLIIILSILTYSIIDMLLKRLKKVIIAMRQVQKGNMDVDIKVEGTDEVSELAYHMKKMLAHIKELIDLVLKKQEVTKNAEIKALQTQINAHFIYNTLETIKMMAEIENQILISDSITSLGRLMHYSMSWSNASVKLQDELDYVKNYINLINVRRENMIILNLSIDKTLYSYQILKMSVQPIIENAVRHGIEMSESDNVIKIKAFINKNSVNIEITDSGIGMDEEEVTHLQNVIDGNMDTVYNTKGNGIGLRNINERIQIFYGKEYGIKVISKKGCFTKICMRLPRV